MAHDLSSLFDGLENTKPVENEYGDPLDDFFQDDAAKRGESRKTDVLYAVMEHGGTARVQDILDLGHDAKDIAACLAKSDDDKRRRPPLVAHVIAGERIVVLSSAGWAAVGRPSKREQKPSAARLAHNLAPTQIRAWVEGITPTLAQHSAGGVEVRCRTDHASINEWQKEAVSLSWGPVRRQSDIEGTYGQMTDESGVPRPDALIYEEWTDLAQSDAQWGRDVDWDGSAYVDYAKDAAGRVKYQPVVRSAILAVEVETKAKSTDNLKSKMMRWNALLDINAVQAVVWVVDDASIALRIQRWTVSAGAGAATESRRHRFVALGAVGGPGSRVVMGLPRPGWWLADLATQAGW